MAALTGLQLRIDLLGGFHVTAGGTAVPESAWRLRKARALLKLLALAPEHTLHREQVIEALWPELDHGAASNNLRQALFVARRALSAAGDDGAARLGSAADALSLAPQGLAIDVEAFEQAAARAAEARDADQHQAAIALYTGELLPEDRFESWAIVPREALRERYLGLLLSLAELHVEAGEDRLATDVLQRAIVAEPLHEPAHRALMRIYALGGRRQRALAQFHLLREALRREFEDEPDDDTRLLYQDILARRIGADEQSDLTPAPRRTEATTKVGNLPLQLTSFVGRDRELRDVLDLARRHRLLTLTGTGGAGKTRLALEAALSLRRELQGGAWLVELAGLSGGALVAPAVGSVLGVESRSSRPSQEALVAHIGEQAMLIVLDNCEHLISACAELAETLLANCPNLKLLVTSREPLHAAGEVDWRVPSLALQEATTLFVERATSVSSRFSADEENAAAVEEICRRVDGIPLAIELAAARVSVLAPAQIAERLHHSLSVLSAARRTALTRQQTLSATLDWSYELLDDDERTLLRRLGAFAGDFDLPAVEDVCEGDLDLLARLVDKSLVVVEEHDGQARYLLLDTVRHYARQKLEGPEADRIQARHRAYYLSLAEELGPHVSEPGPRRRLALEADEMRWALQNAERADPAAALRLATALWRFWHDRGDRMEGARWLELALAGDPEPTALRAAAMHGLSVLALRTSDNERALRNAHAAVAFFREAGDPAELSEELHHLGTLTWVFADYDGALRWCQESQTLAEQIGSAAMVASVQHTLGVISASRSLSYDAVEQISRSIQLLRQLPGDGEHLLFPVGHGYGRMAGPAHRRFLEQTFVTARRVRPAGAVPYALCDLAASLRDVGEVAEARGAYEESLALFRSLGDELGVAQALCQLGNLLAYVGEHEPARELHEESLALREAADDARGTGLSLVAIALGALTAQEIERAREYGERALTLFRRTADGPGQGTSLAMLGYIASAAGDLRLAHELQGQSLEVWRKFIPDARWVSTILLELAELELEFDEPERALRHCRRALESLLRVGDPVGTEQCRSLMQRAENVALTAD